MRRAVLLLAAVALVAAALAAPPARADAKDALRAILEEARKRANVAETDTETKAEPDADTLRKQAHARNVALRNSYWDRADDVKKQEVAALKAARVDECRKVAQDIARLKDSIRKKERERREGERGTLDDMPRRSGSRGSRDGLGHRNRRNRADSNDGLENDKKALKQAEQLKRQLQGEIAAEMSKLDARRSLRKRRVEAVYARHRQAIEAGKSLTPEQMVASYKAALNDLPADMEKAEAPKPNEKPKEAPKQQERKERRRAKEDKKA